MKVALVGFGNVGKAFARLLDSRRAAFPFKIAAIHTAHHGTAYSVKGLPTKPEFGAAAANIEEFLDRARPEVMIEITPLNPETGEPATSHIRAAFERGIHVITANKGPIAHSYRALHELARRAQAEFRFESVVMDGAPVFNMVRNNLPGVQILGFAGCLNSTSKLVIEAMAQGRSMEEGIRMAQEQGIAEADPTLDIDGWDSAAKTAALANVLMNAEATPASVTRSGIGELRADEVRRLAAEGKKVVLVSRAERREGELKLSAKPEVLPAADLLATAHGTSNVLLLHTDLMGTIGTVSLEPATDQTAYGLFSDLVDIAKSI